MRERYATSKLKIWVECVSESRQRLGIKGFYAIKKGTPLYESARALYDDRTGQPPVNKKRSKKQLGKKSGKKQASGKKSRKATKSRKQTKASTAGKQHEAPSNTPMAPRHSMTSKRNQKALPERKRKKSWSERDDAIGSISRGLEARTPRMIK